MNEQTPDPQHQAIPDSTQEQASPRGNETITFPETSDASSTHPLSIALAAAVPLHIHDCFRAGRITTRQLESARAFGRVLASQGDKLLYRSAKPGETAELFNQLAESLAILAHVPGGVQAYGQHFDALAQLSMWVGKEQADAYFQQVWQETENLEEPPATDETMS